MGKLITVIGNSGVGKTTLAAKLCETCGFTSFLEITDDRPFLQKFHDDRGGFCLANQIDFLLYHAEKEIFVREHEMVAVQDGGLDFVFNVFTHRFHQKGYLDDDELKLCERFYSALRLFLSPPDLMIILSAPLEVISERMKKRGREIDIERSQDLIELQKLIDAWLVKCVSVPSIFIDAGVDDPTFSLIMDGLVRDVENRLRI